MARKFLNKDKVQFKLSQHDLETLGEHPNTRARVIVEEWCANERELVRSDALQSDAVDATNATMTGPL